MTTVRAARRLAVGLGSSLLLLLGTAASPALGQEWTIHLRGHTTPVTASFYAEETPWIFFRDDQSQYVFAVGCDRVTRVERGGAQIAPPACPVERLPTTMPLVYQQIMDLEQKRLDDSIAKLREQTRAVAQAYVATIAATGGFSADPSQLAQADLERRRNQDAVAVLQSQIQETLFDIRLGETRVESLLDAAATYPRAARQRFFFFSR